MMATQTIEPCAANNLSDITQDIKEIVLLLSEEECEDLLTVIHSLGY